MNNRRIKLEREHLPRGVNAKRGFVVIDDTLLNHTRKTYRGVLSSEN